MMKEYEALKQHIKDNIKNLVEDGYLDDAFYLAEEYMKLDKQDIDMYSILSVIYMMQNNMKDAESILINGLKINQDNFDINYNLAYVFEQMNNTEKAHIYYKKAYNLCSDTKIKESIEKYITEKEISLDVVLNESKKIAFFVKQGKDSFINNIVENLNEKFETRKIIVSNYDQIEEGMEWADICWFEWCDELIAYGSKSRFALEKKIICRLHSYEAFTEIIHDVNWNNVDDLIFVSKNIKENVLNKINIHPKNTHVIPNGISIDNFTFRNERKGKNIAYIGYINYKKGPMLLLHAFKAIFDYDNSYKLYIAGTFQDERYILYFEQMIKEMGLEKNVFFEGWQNDLDAWMEDKNYILCTSVLESQNVSVMQAMAKGIKPLVHNFVGANDVYEKSYIWNTMSDLIELIRDDYYNSEEYRKFINEKYSLINQMTKIQEIVGYKN